MIQISKKVSTIFIAAASLVVVVYFGTLLYKQLKPQTQEQKMMHCLELGSDQRATACIKLVQQGTVSGQCHFEISEIKEYTEFGGGRLINYTKTYEGTIKNTSDRKGYLKAIIGKLYTKNKVLVETGYTPIEKDVDSGVSLPFKINIRFPSEEGINSLDGLVKDIYPWFTTCK